MVIATFCQVAIIVWERFICFYKNSEIHKEDNQRDEHEHGAQGEDAQKDGEADEKQK